MLRPLALVVALFAAAGACAHAQSYGSVQYNWKILPQVNLTLVPNYQAGFGPVAPNGAPTAAPGPLAGSGYVDFGNVVQGYQYLYRYAVQANVNTNDGNGFNLYAEASGNFQGSSSTWPITNTLFWLVSSGSNSPFSPATTFNVTSSPVGCGGTCINYAGSPPSSALIWAYPTAATSGIAQGYDYELRLTGATPVDSFTANVVYTAVGN